MVLRYINSDSTLISCADADWPRDVDRKVTTVYLFKVFDNTVIRRPKKQATIALNIYNTEAEFISLCETSLEIFWIVRLLKDLGISISTAKMFADNLNTINSKTIPDQKRQCGY